MAEFVTMILFAGVVLATYGFVAAHRDSFDKLFDKLFNEH